MEAVQVGRKGQRSVKRRKHVPLRSCIACRQKSPKRDLIRVVRTPEGVLEIDLKGKKAGRGAYLCRRLQCCEAALQPGRLSQALKSQVSAREAAALRAAVSALLEGAVADPQTMRLGDESAQG